MPERSPRADRVSLLGHALAFGLATGLLELAGEFVRRAILGERAWLSFYQLNPHFLWMVPASDVAIFAVVGLLFALVGWRRPLRVMRFSDNVYWFLLVLTLLLMTHTLMPVASFTLAAGLASVLAGVASSRDRQVRRIGGAVGVCTIVAALGLIVAGSWATRNRPHTPVVATPAPAADRPNVLLIVLDTVRADALTSYGSARNTAPFLARLARQGVQYDHARAPAPWTLASIASMLTGRWPYELSVGPESRLDAKQPTLAGFLTSQGYATAGFAANYIFCTAAYGLDRGFEHYEERSVSFEDLLGSSELGRHLFPFIDRAEFEGSRLLGKEPDAGAVDLRYHTHRKRASDLNREFLGWLGRQQGRPFFAFLNYFDAHAPYLPPRGQKMHFGLRPANRAEYDVLRNWDEDRMKGLWGNEPAVPPTAREAKLARDCYDDCITYMDGQLARLMAELDSRGVLKNTIVIITADHGEEFGENGLYGHFLSLHRAEIDVPLLIVHPTLVPGGRRVAPPVSLRNLPATVVDLLGLGGRSPFPGRSLARFWQAPDGTPNDEPVLSELSTLSLRGLLSGTRFYIHHGDGIEQLFDQKDDPWESRDLARSATAGPVLEDFRRVLAQLTPGAGRLSPDPKQAVAHGGRGSAQGQPASSPAKRSGRY